MDNLTLVRPEHLNHHGYLFGGVMLKWVDEMAWMAASREFNGCQLVTIGMDVSRFKHRVRNGSILRFHMERVRQGTTSVCYSVTVFADTLDKEREHEVFSTQVTFVRLDSQGRPIPLPKLAAP